MKILVTLILFVNLPPMIHSQHYNIGDTLNIVALNGLNLRKSGNTNGVKIGMLSNGEKAIILSMDSMMKDSMDGFNGDWIRVASITNPKLEGYVFDAYLSKYPILNEFECLHDFISGKYRWQDDEMKDFFPALLEEYIKRAFTQPGGTTKYSNGADGEGAHSFELTELEQNNLMIKHSPSEGHGIELELNNPRISEVYYLIMNLLKFLPSELARVNEGLIKSPEYGRDCVGLGENECTVRVVRKENGKISIYFFNTCC